MNIDEKIIQLTNEFLFQGHLSLRFLLVNTINHVTISQVNLTRIIKSSKMQTAESVCLWNYQFKNTSPPSSSSSMNKPSGKKIPVEESPFLSCAERLSCQNEMSSKAMFYCLQCKSLQCYLCDKEIHENSTHERLNLDEMDDESCAIDRRHPAIFFCPTCALNFCYICFENQHQHSDGREHRPRKFRDDQRSKPIKINTSSFEDDHDESPQKKSHPHAPTRHNFNQEMLLESMLDDGEQQVNTNLQNDRGFLLLDHTERLTVTISLLLRSLSNDIPF